ncbi:MAG: PASTA domain-containing protein [Pseudonocardiaceae bacterium]
MTNGGNTPVNAQVAFADQGKVLTFEPRDKQVALQPGNTADVPVMLNGRRKWFGRTEQLPFSAVVSPAGGQPPIMLNGVRQQTAVFPWWMPPAALAAVALAIALLAIFLRTPTVPTIGNEDQQTAIKKLADAGYVPQLQYKTDNDISQGLTLGTDPKGGSPLPKSQVVKLIMSSGKCQGTCPIMVDIPNVVGLSQEDAASRMQQADLGVRTEAKPSDETAGKVIDTEPKAATQLKKGDVVTLMVSKGPQNAPANPAGPSGPAPGGPAPGAPAPGAPGGPAPAPGAPGGPAPGGPAPGAPGGPAPAPGAPGAPGGPPPGGPDTPPAKQVAVPSLNGSSVEDATKALTDLGLKAKTAPDPVHSNAVPDGTVLSSAPKATGKVDPGSEVTLTVAQNTARANLIDTADVPDKAAWTATAATTEKLTFGTAGTTGGLVNKPAGSLTNGRGTLDPSTPTAVLETRPPDGGLITGQYKLEQPVVAGDHLTAVVGLIKKSSTAAEATAANTITFSVVANDQTIKSVTAMADTPQQLDVDLSKAKDANSIKIIATSSGKQDPNLTPVWQDLRLAPKVGK